MQIDGIRHIDYLAKTQKQQLAYKDGVDIQEYTNAVRAKFLELIGDDIIRQNSCEDDFEIESTVDKGFYTQIRFTFQSEKEEYVPCYLLIPKLNKKKYPVVITLQGHATGFHNSIGEPKDDGDCAYALGRGQFAVQAVKQGYIALAVEQRGMGERSGDNAPDRRISLSKNFSEIMCYYQQMTAFMMGRTLIGERCYDISRAIDMLSRFPECDLDKIAITGNSGGGTTSYYAACYDQRIKIAIPSCAFCTYKESILKFYHCSCNYIPSIFRYFEMQDLSCLIAPRALTIVNGVHDPSFLVGGVKEGYQTVEKIYSAFNKKDAVKLIITDKGHWWCEDIIWNEMKEQMAKL